MVELRFCSLHLESLPETCIQSKESFVLMLTMFCSGQEMLYKSQSIGNTSKRNAAMRRNQVFNALTKY